MAQACLGSIYKFLNYSFVLMGQTFKKLVLCLLCKYAESLSDLKMQFNSMRTEHPCKNSNVNARHWWNPKMSENCVQDGEND